LDKSYQLTPAELELGPRSHKEWLQAGNAGVVFELYAPDCVIHSRYVPPQMARGVEGFKDYGVYLHSVFPDLQINDEEIVAEGDMVSMRWLFEGTQEGTFWGIPGTGKHISITGFDLFRIRNGKIQEAWIETDYLGLFQQLGVWPQL